MSSASTNHQAAAVPIEEQMQSCLDHYERLATVAHEWNNQVPQAIRAWYAAKAGTLSERTVVEPSDPAEASTYGILDAAINLLDAHGDTDTAERIRRSKRVIPNVPIYRPTKPSSFDKSRSDAALHACEGLDTADLAGNKRGWLSEVIHDVHRVERNLNSALRARCPGNGDGDDCIVECQLYEASEQRDPCPPGCCSMADEKDVRALMDAIERGDDEEPSRVTNNRSDMVAARLAWVRDLGLAGRPYPGDSGLDGFAAGWQEGFAAAAAQGTLSSTAGVEPDGYAVLLDDPKGETPGGCGYWYVGAYRTEAVAKNVAERQQGARVMPMFFARSARTGVTEEMVSRFLSWRLPPDFAPDCGISFKPVNHPDALTHLWPIGTNLLTAVQARAMLEHVVGAKSGEDEG